METGRAISIQNTKLTSELVGVLTNHQFSKVKDKPFIIHLRKNDQPVKPHSVEIGDTCDIAITFLDGITCITAKGDDGEIMSIDVTVPVDSSFASDSDFIEMFLKTLFQTLSKEQT